MVVLCIGGFVVASLLISNNKDNDRKVVFTNTATPISPRFRHISPTTTDSELRIGWKKYTHPNEVYSIEFPKHWMVREGRKSSIYIVNENAGAPLEMSKDGLWITIDLTTSLSDFNNVFEGKGGSITLGDSYSASDVAKLEDLRIDNKKAVKFVVETKQDANTEYAYKVVYVIKSDDVVVLITALTSNKSTAEAHMVTVQGGGSVV